MMDWFTKAFAKKNDQNENDLELLEKIKVMTRQCIKDMDEDGIRRAKG